MPLDVTGNRPQNVGIILSKSVTPKYLNSRTSRFTNIGTQFRYLSAKTRVNLAFLHVGTHSCYNHVEVIDEWILECQNMPLDVTVIRLTLCDPFPPT